MAARAATEDLRRAFPNSTWTTRAFVQVGQAAEDAKDAVDASYFYRAAVNFYPGAAEVTPAQFYLAWQAHDAKNPPLLVADVLTSLERAGTPQFADTVRQLLKV